MTKLWSLLPTHTIIVSNNTTSWCLLIILCVVMWSLMYSCDVLCTHVMSCVSCDVLCTHVMSCVLMWCLVHSCDVLCTHVMYCVLMWSLMYSCDVLCTHMMYCVLMWCLVYSCDLLCCMCDHMIPYVVIHSSLHNWRFWCNCYIQFINRHCVIPIRYVIMWCYKMWSCKICNHVILLDTS